MCSPEGATVGSKENLSEDSTPTFRNNDGRRWRMLTAFIRRDLFLPYDTIGNTRLEIQKFFRRAIATVI